MAVLYLLMNKSSKLTQNLTIYAVTIFFFLIKFCHSVLKLEQDTKVEARLSETLAVDSTMPLRCAEQR